MTYNLPQVVFAVETPATDDSVAVGSSVRQSSPRVLALEEKSLKSVYDQPLHVHTIVVKLPPVRSGPLPNVPPIDSQSSCDWVFGAVNTPP